VTELAEQKAAEQKADVPKIVAMIILFAPTLVLRTGVSYLRMRRAARRSGARFRQELVRGGMPSKRAKALSWAYESELRLTKVLRLI